MKKQDAILSKNRLIKFAFAKAILLYCLFLVSCNNAHYGLEKVAYNQTTIDSTLKQDASISQFIAPYKKSLDQQMQDELAYNPASMSKSDTPYNTAIGNMLAFIVKHQSDAVFEQRTGERIDAIILNHGGIRAPIDQGPVTMRTAYEVMPFENQIVVAALTPEQMKDMIAYLVRSKSAHPIEGIKIELNKNGQLRQATIAADAKGVPEKYFVATSDYLYNGGDNMNFFKGAPITRLDYKIRNAMIDYFKSVDTLDFKSDDRFSVID